MQPSQPYRPTNIANTDPIHQSIQQVITERDVLRAEVESLRCEALAWHSKAEEQPAGTRITIETTDPGVGEWFEGLVLAAKDRKQLETAAGCNRSDVYSLLIAVRGCLRRYRLLLRDGMQLAAEHNLADAQSSLALAIAKVGNGYATPEE